MGSFLTGMGSHRGKLGQRMYDRMTERMSAGQQVPSKLYEKLSSLYGPKTAPAQGAAVAAPASVALTAPLLREGRQATPVEATPVAPMSDATASFGTTASNAKANFLDLKRKSQSGITI